MSGVNLSAAAPQFTKFLQLRQFLINCVPFNSSVLIVPLPSAIPPPLGIIMLDTQFLRPLGDAGNPDSWPFPIIIERVEGAFAQSVVSGTYEGIESFIEAGRRLVKRGACAVITTCGFLVRHQRALEVALVVPVRTSTLSSYNALQQELGPTRRVAILTIDKVALGASVRTAAGIPDDALIFDLSGESHFRRAILDAEIPLDAATAQGEWVRLAKSIQKTHLNIGRWLFECANMPPYARSVAEATGLAVYDALAMGTTLYRSAHP
ncbi:MAG: aspartate/glutamate racemase family protein [Casimicrobium sp.]